jgi:WD40 repeat protein
MKLSDFLNDAIRLALVNASIYDSMPLQIYSSVLAFTPQKSIVREMFENEIPEWISLRPEAQTNWSQCLQILEGHSVNSVIFSHDSAFVASGGDKTIRIWRADTGECVQELQGHSSEVSSVAFSHDSALVASGGDKTVRIWRADTGECVQKVDIGRAVMWLSFESDDSRLLTSVGAIIMERLPLSEATIDKTSTTQLISNPGRDYLFGYGYGFSRDGCWITWHGHNLLWLPVEFRPIRSAVSGSTVVIGCFSGRVIFIRFSTQKLPKILSSS